MRDDRHMFAPVGAVFFVHRPHFCGKITAVGSLFTYTPAAPPKMYSLCQNQLGFSVDANYSRLKKSLHGVRGDIGIKSFGI